MSVCKRFLVLVLVLDWNQCLPQGGGAPPAMLRCRLTGFPKNWGPGPLERQDKVHTICTVPIDCDTLTTRRLYPFGAWMECAQHLLVGEVHLLRPQFLVTCLWIQYDHICST